LKATKLYLKVWQIFSASKKKTFMVEQKTIRGQETQKAKIIWK
jgi:hypothetical protein